MAASAAASIDPPHVQAQFYRLIDAAGRSAKDRTRMAAFELVHALRGPSVASLRRSLAGEGRAGTTSPFLNSSLANFAKKCECCTARLGPMPDEAIWRKRGGLMNPGNDHSTDGDGFPIEPQDRHFVGFLEAAPDAVVIVDKNGAIAQVNGQTEKLFGYSRQELFGAPLEMLIPERFRSAHVGRTRDYAANPYPRPMGVGLDLFGLRKDGGEFPIDVSISPLPSDDGLFVASTIRDITAHRRLESELRQRTRDMEEADRQKDNYLSAVAHELRTPLGTLTLVAEVLRRSQGHTEAEEQLLIKLGRQTAHMGRLIEDLLDMTRVRCGTLTLRLQLVDLRRVVADALEIAQPLVDDRNQHLLSTPCAEPVVVNGDSTRLVQVVTNLLANAARYTPEGGHIWCSTAKDERAATIRIRDDGIGIQKEMLSRIFELFTRAAHGGGESARGLGIGLALVRRLVELHGGTVVATSAGENRGSELMVQLPLASAVPQTAPA